MPTSLEAIAAFRPSPQGDNWRELDAHVQAVTVDLAAIPTLLRVFERFPRHDGHGVMWGILHAIEAVPGYEPILVEHVMRTPTEMGVTMLKRLLNAGITHVGVHELASLVVMLAPRAPIIDCTVDAERTAPVDLAPLLGRLAAFAPPDTWDVDWSPLRAIVDELVATAQPAIVTPLLQTLDRFHARDGFSPFWPIVNGLEQLPDWPALLVASMRTTTTRNGLTLLLRLFARGITHAGDVDIAAFAAECMAANDAGT